MTAIIGDMVVFLQFKEFELYLGAVFTTRRGVLIFYRFFF